MRLRITGDWAAAIVFALTGALALAWVYFVSAATVDLRGDPVATSRLARSVVAALAGASGIFAVASAIAASVGRSVPDGSTWESWKNVGMDARGIVGSVGLLLLAGGALIFLIDAYANPVQLLLVSAMGIGFLWAAVMLTLGARIVAFAPDRTVIVLRGKPFAFSRKEYRAGTFTELRLVESISNAGGIHAYHPDTIYSVYGICTGRPVELARTTIAEDVRGMVDDVARKTGLSAPEISE